MAKLRVQFTNSQGFTTNNNISLHTCVITKKAYNEIFLSFVNTRSFREVDARLFITSLFASSAVFIIYKVIKMNPFFYTSFSTKRNIATCV